MDKKLAKVQKRLRKQTDDPDTKAERKRRNKEKHLKDEERRDASIRAKEIIAEQLDAKPTAITDRFSSTADVPVSAAMSSGTKYGLQTRVELQLQNEEAERERVAAEVEVNAAVVAAAAADTEAKKQAERTKKKLKAKKKMASMAKLSFADDEEED